MVVWVSLLELGDQVAWGPSGRWLFLDLHIHIAEYDHLIETLRRCRELLQVSLNMHKLDCPRRSRDICLSLNRRVIDLRF